MGKVPLEWYKDEEHIGYDKEGQRIVKSGKRDKLDALLDRNDSARVPPHIVIQRCVAVLRAANVALPATFCVHACCTEIVKQQQLLTLLEISGGSLCHCLRNGWGPSNQILHNVAWRSGAPSTTSTTTRR